MRPPRNHDGSYTAFSCLKHLLMSSNQKTRTNFNRLQVPTLWTKCTGHRGSQATFSFQSQVRSSSKHINVSGKMHLPDNCIYQYTSYFTATFFNFKYWNYFCHYFTTDVDITAFVKNTMDTAMSDVSSTESPLQDDFPRSRYFITKFLYSYTRDVTTGLSITCYEIKTNCRTTSECQVWIYEGIGYRDWVGEGSVVLQGVSVVDVLFQTSIEK